MNFYKKLLGDFFGLFRILGPYFALKWAAMVFIHLPSIFRKKDLQPADWAMGGGSISCPLSTRCGFQCLWGMCLLRNPW